MSHRLLIPAETRGRLAGYLAALRAGSATAGARLKEQMAGMRAEEMTEAQFLLAVVNTKVPCIFAESAVAGDGSDWNPTELGLLGDLSIAVPVTIFDDGHHTRPKPHARAFPGSLIFTPGALLRNGRGGVPADWAEVTWPDGRLNPEGYFALYERRLLPVFFYIQECAASEGKSALLTLPGLGCGQFAGPFAGKLGSELQRVLGRFLVAHGRAFPNLKVVYYDPYGECENLRREIHGISLLVRPLLRGNEGKSQLCPPRVYEEEGDDFSGCLFFSLVAWDHVSWPGNDFFAGARCTDDGVKAAATDSMAVLTGLRGHYSVEHGAYVPPAPYSTWEQVVRQTGVRL